MKKQLTTIMVRGDTVVVLRHTGNGIGASVESHRKEYKLSEMSATAKAMFDAVLAKLDPHPVKGSSTVFYRRRYSNGKSEAMAS